MIKYLLYQKNPASHYIYIDLLIENVQKGLLQLQLPSWRPGRYELGNFAKNIKRVDVWDSKNQNIAYTKLNKDLWEVPVNENGDIKITYSYFAAELNAGACFADVSQLYVNPVHCCMMVKGREEKEHQLELQIPDHYSIATSLKVNKNLLLASDYEELVDSPFIASSQLKTENYVVNDITFYLHFNGECAPDWKKIKKDFTAFTKRTISFWNDFPEKEYHFIFQVLPTKFYHGVEHKKNTVIAIGPGYAINTGSTYEDVLGVSCHELFHTWNVKTIRPAEMMPYDLSRENYARTGYVYEGFTTYYGDKLLYSSGVFTFEQYCATLEERLQKHFHNFGRYNLSVAQSSWETWLDGYMPGAPYRKTNIYDEGCLISFMLDVMILQATGNSRSLRDVCVLLYERFGKKGIGYNEGDIIELVKEVAGTDMHSFFADYVYSPNDFEKPITECFTYLGLQMTKENTLVCENQFGFKVTETPALCRITLVAPYSPAWKGGLFAGDDIIAVNGMMVRGNLNSLLSYFKEEEEIIISASSGEMLKQFSLKKDKKGMTWFFQPKIKSVEAADPGQKTAFAAWKS
jgi:predicted metalloprotease with PDZ domain